jgi:hypothetical protein
VPDARTIWLFWEKLTKAGAIELLFARFDATLREAGYIGMSGQIVDASLIAAQRQRNTEDEKQSHAFRPSDVFNRSVQVQRLPGSQMRHPTFLLQRAKHLKRPNSCPHFARAYRACADTQNPQAIPFLIRPHPPAFRVR